ncbi:hypothetical protein [Deinococcus sp. Arct2-2]|uniref:hypothetical protein n=1 Tax=Deinococcus sp. Arct2-2 TaxID=2568653 RepID=UPI001F1150D2|nr:hypothetical protein [Deinococcus sp. Arct2-2]
MSTPWPGLKIGQRPRMSEILSLAVRDNSIKRVMDNKTWMLEVFSESFHAEVVERLTHVVFIAAQEKGGVFE